ncbi:MAG: hypothetical protein OHK0038_10830 [Flammeovirgaceae bacterium]
MKKILLSLLTFCLLLATKSNAQTGNEVMIQGFNWESWKNTSGWYNVLKNNAVEVKNGKFDLIWFPPMSDAASNEGYLPRQLYVLNSKYGTEQQLKDAINAMHANNVKVLADIVINHRVGTANWADFTNPTWGCWSVVNSDEWSGKCGNADSGDGYGAARDLDHSNATVQNDIKTWMNWLKTNIGFDGWRYDYVRGYWGGYNKIYNQGTNPVFSVGELWDNLDLNNPDPHRQQIINWIDATGGTSTAFDFTTKGVLQQAVQGELWRLNRSGKAPGVIGWYPARAVTFLDNHDTGSTQAHWPFPGDKVMQGYAYILTHPGIPCVFWDHYFDWGLKSQIQTLINIRKNQGLNSTSVLSIQQATANLYAAIIDSKVAMKIGSDSWSPGAGWTLAASGTNYAVWTKDTSNPKPVLTVTPASGNYSSAISVVMSATDNGSISGIYYTTNGTTPTTSSTRYTTPITISANTTIKAIAVDNLGVSSDLEERVYTFSSTTTTSFTVFFKKPTSWAAPKIHYWNVLPSGTASTWPGVNMTDDGGGWYKFTFNNADASNLLFHDGTASNKTPDLTRTGDGWYDNGTWYATDPRIAPPGTGLKIHFKKPSSWSTATIYYWNPSPGGAPAVTWPGVTMTAEADGWFVYTIPFANCSNIIFSNNGASKTADLTRCEEGWYDNGTWYSSKPSGGTTTGFTVFFKPTGYTNPNIYYWNVTPTQITTTWPGPKMTASTNGWFKFTFTGATCANLIFSNNGASQTADLSRCNSNGWYTNGVWSNTPPSGAPTSRESEELADLEENYSMELAQNFPNPFKGRTTFDFTIEEDANVSLRVFNAAGQEVAVVVSERLQRGKHLVEWDASGFEAGIYYYRLDIGKEVVTKRLIIAE